MGSKNIVVGAGITGLTIAERLASKGEEVLIIEKRDHIGGNCYDFLDENGNYVQQYGPHIFHTKLKEVWDYLSQFTEWNDYSHKVVGWINGKLINIPFNLNSIDATFDKEEAEEIKKVLIEEFGKETKIPILDLRKHSNPLIKKLADYVYENVFLNYTMKQWDLKPEEIDPSVTARVPVFISRDNRYFQDPYKGLPKNGFTAMMKKMIENPLIKVKLGEKFKEGKYDYDRLFYTGPLDEFFDFKFGKIKYRRVDLRFEKHDKSSYQSNSVVNYPNTEDFTRITEFNKFLFIENSSTMIAKEYPSWTDGFQAYPVQTEENKRVISKYLQEGNKLDNVVFAGRLAECKYYNMDQAVKRALEVGNEQ
jgi:UDP-galactopyranose mutase